MPSECSGAGMGRTPGTPKGGYTPLKPPKALMLSALHPFGVWFQLPYYFTGDHTPNHTIPPLATEALPHQLTSVNCASPSTVYSC